MIQKKRKYTKTGKEHRLSNLTISEYLRQLVITNELKFEKEKEKILMCIKKNVHNG